MKMDELTALIKAEIKRQYKSVRRFAAEIDVPQSTIISAMRKGVAGTAFETVLKICSALDIKLSMNSGVFMDKENSELLVAFSQLDEIGKHTVKTVCSVETLRCKNVPLMTIVNAALEMKHSSQNSAEKSSL